MAKRNWVGFLSSKQGLLLVGFVGGVCVTLLGVRSYHTLTKSQLRQPAQAVETETVKKSVPELIAELSSPNEFDRGRAAEALGKRGAEAMEAVQKLTHLLKDPATFVPSRAAEALGFIGSAEAVPGLVEATKDSRAWVRAYATEALGRITPLRAEAVVALADAYLDSDAIVRSNAATALKKFGPAASAAAPTLIKFLAGSRLWDWPQDVACQVLETIGTEEILPDLQKLKEQKNGHFLLRYYAKEIIEAIAARSGT